MRAWVAMSSNNWAVKQKEQSKETFVQAAEVPTAEGFGSMSGQMSHKRKVGLATIEKEKENEE